MSRSIDERVVEMRFDNKQFESAIKDSIASLTRLEEILNKNISSDSLDNIEKAANNVDLSGLIKSVETISDRFSTLGIVGMTVIQNLTNALINGLGGAIRSVTDSIVSGGIKRAMNIENAHFQLQGLIDDENEVQAIMKEANESVNDTAYSYDEAAKAASMFTASGIRSGEQMEQALKGIAGVAATTNSEYEGISRIFTTVAGQGRLMGDQLLQLSTRGMNAAAALKDFFNGVSKGTITASDKVTKAIKDLTGTSDAVKQSSTVYKDALNSQYEAASEKFNEEYKLRQKTLNNEYKALQKTLNDEYNARKKAYDNEYNALKESLDKEYEIKQKEFNKEYKARQEAYNKEYTELKKSLDEEYNLKKETFDKEFEELAKSLDEEIKAQEKANSNRIKEADKAYKEDVTNFKKATEEKIALIDKQYTENLKLIDKEAYEKTKVLEDQIAAIEKAADEEEKERKLIERNIKLSELQEDIDYALSQSARDKAEKALIDYQKKINAEDLAESRKLQKAKLKDEIAAIKEEASIKKETAKERRDEGIQIVKEEANVTLETMAETYDRQKELIQSHAQDELDKLKENRDNKLKELKKSQTDELNSFRETQNLKLETLRENQESELETLKENQNAELETLRKGHQNQLTSLKESQNNELEALREGQNGQLETLKESQNAQLEALKKANDAKLKEMKKAQKEQEKSISSFATDAEITEANIREMVSKGLISFDIFAEAMASTFGEHAKDANHTFVGALSNIRAALARTGALLISPLIEQDGELVKFFNVIRVKINDFNKALGASNGIAKLFTDWIKSIVSKLTSFIENIEIANVITLEFYDKIKKTYESATQSMKDMGDGTEKIVNQKIYTPFHALQDIIFTVVNIFKGLYSIIKPIGKAFKDVFLSFDSKDLYEFIENIRIMSQNLKLSEENSERLKKGFTGLFSIIKTVASIFVRLFKAINPNIESSDNFRDSIFGLIETVGNLLEKFSNWINTSSTVELAISAIGSAISLLRDALSEVLKVINFVVSSINLDDISRKLYEISGIDLTSVIKNVKDFIYAIFNLSEEDMGSDFEDSGESIVNGLIKGITNKIEDIRKSITGFANIIIKEFKDIMGIHSPSKVFEELGGFIIEGLINGISNGFSKVKEVVTNLAGNLFGSLTDSSNGLSESLSGIIALLGGGSLIYLILSLAKGFKQISSSISNAFGISSVLSSIGKIAKSYAADLKAEAFKKVALAISAGIITITASLVILSKQDPDKLMTAVKALAVTMVVFGGVVGILYGILLKLRSIETTMLEVSKGFTKALKRLSKAVLIKSVTWAIKDIATAIGIIILDIAGIMYLKKDHEAEFNDAVYTVLSIAAVILGIIAIMSSLGNTVERGMTAFAKVGAGMLALSLSILISVKAVKEILSLDFNASKDQEKLNILILIFALVGTLALAVGAASGIAGKGGLKTGPLLAMCLLIVTSVFALKSVLKLEVTVSWKKKLLILGALFSALTILIISMGIASKLAGENGLKAAGTILSLCALIVTIIGAIGILSIFPVEPLKKGVLSLGIILLMMAGILVLTSKASQGDPWKSVLAMSLMVGVVVAAIAFLSFIEWNRLIPSALSLGVVLLSIALVFSSVSKITNKMAWLNVLSMCAILYSVVKGLEILSKVESWQTLIAAALSMAVVLVSISNTLSKISKSAPLNIDHIIEIAIGLLSVCVIANILKSTSDGMSWDSLLGMALSISAVMLAIAKTFKIMDNIYVVEQDKLAAIIVGCIGAGIIGYALSKVSGAPWDSLLGMAVSISAVMLAIGGAFRIMDSTNEIGIDKLLAIIIGCIGAGIIGLILSQVSGAPWDSLLGMAVSISAVMLAIGGAFKIMDSVNEIGIDKILAIIIGCIGAGIIGAILSEVSGAPWDSLLGMAASISAVLVAIGLAFRIMGSIEVSITAIAAFLAGCVGVVGIGYALSMAANHPWQDLLAAGISISVVILALSIAMLLCSAAGAMAPAAIIGIGLLDAFIADLTLVLLALGALTKIEGFNELIDAGGGVLTKIGSSLGGFVGSIVGGIGEAIGKSLEKIGTNLSNFMNNAKPFFDGLKDINSETASSAASLAAVMLALSTAELLNGFSSLISVFVGQQNIDEFGKKLVAFGEYVKGFDEATRGVDGENLKRVSEGTTYLLDLAKKIPYSGGLVAEVTGDNDIGIFGQSLSVFGRYLAIFDTYINGIDTSGYPNLVNGMSSLLDFAKEIPNVGGLVAAITGDNDIGIFGQSLNTFGYWFRSFDSYVNGIDISIYPNLVNGLLALLEFAKKIPDAGGLVSLVTGDNDIGQFGSSLNTFGYWFRSFDIYTKEIDSNRIMSLYKPLDMLITICKKMEIVDQNVISSFGITLANMAQEGLSQFISVFTAKTPIAISTVKTSINSISLSVQNDSSVATAFKDSAERSVNMYIATITKLTPSVVLSLREMIRAMIAEMALNNAQFEVHGRDNALAYREAFQGRINVLPYYFEEIIKSMMETATKSSDRFEREGIYNASAFIKGFENDNIVNRAKDAAKEILKAAINEFDDIYDRFEELGKDAGRGFAHGLDDKVNEVADRARDMAREARRSIEDELGINSPSRVFREDGRYSGQGFALGMLDWVNGVKEASSELGKTATDGLDEALSEFNTDVDIDPVITPMVDLTNVLYAADEINSMFNDALGNVTGNVTKASNTMKFKENSNNTSNNQDTMSDPSSSTITFNQYNTSPKALSRIDIYRQTRNQLSQFKEAMNGI